MIATKNQYLIFGLVVFLMGASAVMSSGCKTKSGDASLAGLVLSPGTLIPLFNPAILEYDAVFTFFPRSVTVTATVNHSAATMTVNQVEVPSGSPYQVNTPTPDGKIRIIVAAEDGVTTRIYILNLVETD